MNRYYEEDPENYRSYSRRRDENYNARPYPHDNFRNCAPYHNLNDKYRRGGFENFHPDYDNRNDFREDYYNERTPHRRRDFDFEGGGYTGASFRSNSDEGSLGIGQGYRDGGYDEWEDMRGNRNGYYEQHYRRPQGHYPGDERNYRSRDDFRGEGYPEYRQRSQYENYLRSRWDQYRNRR
jgi:hypothetical protein